MGIAEKIANAKKSNWVSEGISKSEVKTIVELAKISAQIERCRLDMGMTQQKFAEYMGVTQGDGAGGGHRLRHRDAVHRRAFAGTARDRPAGRAVRRPSRGQRAVHPYDEGCHPH